MKRLQREAVIATDMDGTRLGKAIRGVEAVTGIKMFLTLTVTAFHLAIMAGRIGVNG